MTHGARAAGCFRFGAFQADPSSGELRKDGRKIRLQEQPFQILISLLIRPGEVVTREELREKLWSGDTFVDFEHGLNNAVNRLREALCDSADAPRYIETLPRRGYRFVASVEVTDHPALSPAEAGSMSPAALPTGSAALESAARRNWVSTKWMLAAGAAVAATFFLWTLLQGGPQRWYRSLLPAPQIQSIAIIPLENLSGDPTQDYLVDALTDGLTTSLAQLPGIRVISRASAMGYKGTKKTLTEIAGELQVDAIVEGSVSLSNGLIHVNTQLVFAPGDRSLWAHSYDTAPANLPGLQSEIAAGVAKTIGVAPAQDPARPAVAHSANPEAYELYLRAVPYYGIQTREATDRAMRLLERAVVLDPGFAAAYAALATEYRDRGFGVEINKTDEWEEKAMAAVQRALALDPNLAEAYVSRGYLLWSRTNSWAHERAVNDYRHALALNANLAEAHHQLASVYNHVGLFEKGELEIKKAVELDPLNAGIRFRVSVNLARQGKYEEFLIVAQDGEKFHPPTWAFAYADALQHLGRREEAERRISEFLASAPEDPGGLMTAMQAVLAADTGDAHEAELKIRAALEKGKGFQHFHHVSYAVASAYALLNRPEQALRYLQVTAEDGFPCYPLFEQDRNLDHVRRDPRIQSFLSGQKKQWEYFQAHL